jgi:hypothetical protein
MKKLFFLLMLLGLVFVVSSIFKGGDYVRLIAFKTGVNLYSVADVADSFRLDDFMAKRSSESRAKEKRQSGGY